MNTQIAKIPLRQVQDVKTLLHNDQARQQLAAVAAKHMSPERLMRVTANAIRTTPKLQRADPLSFLGALMQCAALGLEPNTVLGHAYLIPFDKKEKNKKTGRWEVVGTQVQLVIGYKGFIDLARRSGHITSISAGIHYSDDELWEHEEGTEARLRHRPGPQEGEKLHAYAIAKFTDGGHAYVVLPWAKVMQIRDNSENWKTAVRYGKQQDTPWAKHEDAMAAKTAIRALAKFLPLSVEMADALTIDHDQGTRVDYAAFAQSPEDGPQVEEGEEIDGEATEVEEGSDEQQDAGQQEAPEKTKDKPTQKTSSERKPEAKEEQDKPKDDDAGIPPASDPKFVKLFQDIEAELTDGAPARGILKFHEAALAEVEKEDPDLHGQIMSMIREAEAND
ncbi:MULTISPECIES: recombinase RecT [unclassified Mameliella]|uniref:recombinase RecT n=1 Tax=unclassified Mameliella TaxID=2630630 RepID=UPI00273DFA23|nr:MULTISPECIES: recombinase RecT [unclassified Mameliella]